MAATAMDQHRLKQEAGIPATGRKSAQSVLHLSLSWHPEEREQISDAEMRRAADGALKALGASDRQALIIRHTDEEQPHIHILVNRVSPQRRADALLEQGEAESLALGARLRGRPGADSVRTAREEQRGPRPRRVRPRREKGHPKSHLRAAEGRQRQPGPVWPSSRSIGTPSAPWRRRSAPSRLRPRPDGRRFGRISTARLANRNGPMRRVSRRSRTRRRTALPSLASGTVSPVGRRPSVRR